MHCSKFSMTYIYLDWYFAIALKCKSGKSNHVAARHWINIFMESFYDFFLFFFFLIFIFISMIVHVAFFLTCIFLIAVINNVLICNRSNPKKTLKLNIVHGFKIKETSENQWDFTMLLFNLSIFCIFISQVNQRNTFWTV